MKKQTKKINSIFRGIVIFIIASILSWLTITGIIEVLSKFGIAPSPWVKISIGVIGLIIISILGWRTYK